MAAANDDSPLRILVTLSGEMVSPRFDLTTAVSRVLADQDRGLFEERTTILARPSADLLCQHILNEKIDVLLCGGIEDAYYAYLSWKRIRVLDNIIGDAGEAVRGFLQGTLQAGDCLLAPLPTPLAPAFSLGRRTRRGRGA